MAFKSAPRCARDEDAIERARRLEIYVQYVNSNQPIQYIAREVKDDQQTASS